MHCEILSTVFMLFVIFLFMWGIFSLGINNKDTLVRWPWWRFRAFRLHTWCEEENAARQKAYVLICECNKSKGLPPPIPPDRLSVR